MNYNQILMRTRLLRQIDFRVISVILCLMTVSLIVISSYTGEVGFLTPVAKKQIQWFVIGSVVYAACALLDYNKLREWTWILYALMLLSLIGLFFTGAIARVHRWYRIPILGMSFQPSEFAKLVVVIALAWFLERRRGQEHRLSTAALSGLIVGVPFLLILKQPDLGSALVLWPITLVMFYFGGLHPLVLRTMTLISVLFFSIVLGFMTGLIDHDAMRPYATTVLKEYQYDRLDPNTHHQRASQMAIAVGGFSGRGWRQGEYTHGGWLPMAETDSVFPAFGEEFGFLGLSVLMLLFYALIAFSFQVASVAKDHFGRFLAAGVAVYLAMHILVNIGMMVGLLPITGVPLVLVTYGGSSVLFTMAALGILQSVYSRRFMF
jgi:rod shape determining protein RodA